MGSEYRAIGDPAANATAEQFAEWERETHGRLTRWEERVTIAKGESEAVACAFEADGARFDFVFLDADHSYPGRLADLAAWVPLVKPGGIVAGGVWESSFGGNCCQRAVLDYLGQRGWGPTLLFGPAGTWAFVKPEVGSAEC